VEFSSNLDPERLLLGEGWAPWRFRPVRVRETGRVL
jgi:hypothetical protein